MLDVHPPHSRLENLQDFFLHLFTITIGLLIALSLEGLVEWRHHVHLVDEANSTLRQELQYNLKSLRGASEDLKKSRAALDANIALMRKIQENPRSPEARNAGLNMGFDLTDLRDTAWRTAQSTGALSYMSYSQAEEYSDTYKTQDAFVASQDPLKDDEARYLGLAHRFNLAGEKAMTAEQTSELAGLFGEMKMHYLWVHLALHVSMLSDEAILDGKTMPKSYHENVHD